MLGGAGVLGGVDGVGGTAGSLLAELDTDGGGAVVEVAGAGGVCGEISSWHFCLLSLLRTVWRVPVPAGAAAIGL